MIQVGGEYKERFVMTFQTPTRFAAYNIKAFSPGCLSSY